MIVVDTSAVCAILQGEPEGAAFVERIAEDGGVLSAGTVVELGAVTSKEDTAHKALLEFLMFPFIEIEGVDAKDALNAVDAYRRFGKGLHPAHLNFGDTFAYALARKKDLPLLFKGNDFSLTDVESAIPA